jgi:hypothetical protein
MKAIKIVGAVFLVYVLIVVAFESLLGYFQPYGEGMMVITTTDSSGESKPRVVAKLESEGKLYAAANHWPRAWYNQTLENPMVTVTIGDTEAAYTAVKVSDAEHERVDAEHSLPAFFRVLTGFPPRLFVRLDPREDSS